MHYVRSGHILFCRDYATCRDFYRDVLQLPVMFEHGGKEPLCCFDLGGSYLMVEHAPDARSNGNKLRLHVEDFGPVEEHLRGRKIPFRKRTFPWGTTLEVIDPEGNITSIRDEALFGKVTPAV